MQLITGQRLDRGDTLIEVIFAFAIFSLLAVGTILIMNQGIATAQRSLEITLVRQQIDGQAAALRYIQQEHIGAISRNDPAAASDEWTKIVTTKSISNASKFGLDPTGKCPAISSTSNAFIMDPVAAKVSSVTPESFSSSTDTTTPPFAQVFYAPPSPAFGAKGIWVQAVHHAGAVTGGHLTDVGYIDFHIRACWDSVGSTVPVTMGTIVRLYEPTA